MIIDNRGAACSVSDIARQAGIGKGSIYYYFKSREEILDALVTRTYGTMIDSCAAVIAGSSLPAVKKMALLFQSYYASIVNNSVDRYLHERQNAAIHQKSLAMILTALAPVEAEIIEQGNQEKVFDCSFPEEFSVIILAEFCFVFDAGIFDWTTQQMLKKLQALIEFLERSLPAPAGSFNFLLTFFES